MEIVSKAFNDGQRIPDRHTCQGAGISPELSFSSTPRGTVTLALVLEDPDAPSGVFTHWVVYNIPPSSTGLADGIPPGQLVDGTLQGKNDMGKNGYYGPCPPPGRLHHYNFHLYALDNAPGLPNGASKKQLLAALQGHILAQARLTGTYQR